MAKSFHKLAKETMSPEAMKEANELTQQYLLGMELSEIRKKRNIPQTSIAELLEIQQAAVSKLERRKDMYISSLRKLVHAMGGELDIIVRFPDESIRINQFLEDSATP